MNKTDPKPIPRTFRYTVTIQLPAHVVDNTENPFTMASVANEIESNLASVWPNARIAVAAVEMRTGNRS